MDYVIKLDSYFLHVDGSRWRLVRRSDGSEVSESQIPMYAKELIELVVKNKNELILNK